MHAINYDGKEKQKDNNFLNSLYAQKRDGVITAYEKEKFEDSTIDPPTPTTKIQDVETLLKDYSQKAENFGKTIADAILNKYDAVDTIYCGYSFDKENENACITSIVVNVATKTGETERTYSKYTAVFDPIKLDDIADGKALISNAKSALINQSKYDAKEMQNDEAFLSSLYSQDDFTFKAYEKETFPTQEITTIQDLIANCDIDTKLNTLYRYAVSRSYTTQDAITSYQWDLGELNEDGKIENMQITLKYDSNGSSSNISVVSVKLKTPVTPEEFSNATLTLNLPQFHKPIILIMTIQSKAQEMNL